MKRVLISMALAMTVGFAFAQESAVKEAKKAAKSGNFAQAELLINQALANPATMNVADTWNEAGQIQKSKGAKQMENQVLRKAYDEEVAYSAALNMTKFFMKCDELAQKPDEKGKVKNKFRSSNANAILGDRGNLVNGGIYYFNQQSKESSEQALEYLALYVDVANHPILEGKNIAKTDTLIPTIAYYAALAAIRCEKYDAVSKYAAYAVDSKENGEAATELVVTALKQQEKTDEWMSALKAAIAKYPSNQTFFANMIDYYSASDNYDEAIKFADDQIAKDPENYFYYYVKGYLYSLMKNDDMSIEFYKKSTEKKADFADAWAYMARAYVLKAQDFSASSTTNPNDPKFKEDQVTLQNFYKEALPYYEKAKELAADRPNLWKQGLSSVYYNLGMTDKYEELMK